MPSSVIRHFDYDAAHATLTIDFVSGRRYRYLDVPSPVALALGAASSKGRYFSRHIRNRFRYEQLR